MRIRSMAVAVAVGIAAGQAPDVGALPPGEAPDYTIKIAGSTIQDLNLVKLLETLCLPNTLDQYRDNDATGKGTYYRAFYCQLDSSKVTGLASVNPKVLILKRNRSGAITGVYPLLEPGKAINMMGIANDLAGGTEPQCTRAAGGGEWSCRTDRPGDVFKTTPDLGVSDVDPQLLRGVNYSSAIDGVAFNPPTVAGVTAVLTVKNAGAVVQGIPVSRNLRDALQEAQVAMGQLQAICATDAAEREKEYCMPSLSRSLIASLFAGRIGKWSDIKVEYRPAGAAAATSLPLSAYHGGPGNDDLVRLCRRNRGASTQASFNAHFLNTPCSATGTVPVEEAESNPIAGPIVLTPTQVTIEENCLADFNDGTNNSAVNPGLAKAWAIGMLTTERNTSLARNYRYVKIDGAAPKVEEVAAGRYPYFSEAAYLWRKADPKPAGDTLTIIQKIATEATAPSMFGQINKTITHPWGQGSFIAVSSQGYPVAHPFDPDNPVSAYTHTPGDALPDNCRVPQADDSPQGKTPNL
jgi:hypothetical protein